MITAAKTFLKTHVLQIELIKFFFGQFFDTSCSNKSMLVLSSDQLNILEVIWLLDLLAFLAQVEASRPDFEFRQISQRNDSGSNWHHHCFTFIGFVVDLVQSGQGIGGPNNPIITNISKINVLLFSIGTNLPQNEENEEILHF